MANVQYRVMFGLRVVSYQRDNQEWIGNASSVEDARAKAIAALRAGQVWYGDDERSKLFEEVEDTSSVGPYTSIPRFSVHSIEIE